jgi:hypothetical protein
MKKVKLTEEQANTLELLKRNFGIEYVIRTKVKGFINNDKILNTLKVEDICQAIYIGYEIERPPAPEYHSSNFEITYNVGVDDLKHNKDNAIYFAIKRPSITTPGIPSSAYKAISFEEAGKVRDALDELIGYYEKYYSK